MALSKSFHEVSINGRSAHVMRAVTTDDTSGLVTATVYTVNHGTRKEVIRMNGDGKVWQQERVTPGSYVSVHGRIGQSKITSVDVAKRHGVLHELLRHLGAGVDASGNPIGR